MTRSLASVQPAEPFADVKRRIAEAVDRHRDEILELSHRIHANPEPAFEELQAGSDFGERIGTHVASLGPGRTVRSDGRSCCGRRSWSGAR